MEIYQREGFKRKKGYQKMYKKKTIKVKYEKLEEVIFITYKRINKSELQNKVDLLYFLINLI